MRQDVEIRSHYIIGRDVAPGPCVCCRGVATAWSQREGRGGVALGVSVYHCRKDACWAEGRRIAGIARTKSRKRVWKLREKFGIFGF